MVGALLRLTVWLCRGWGVYLGRDCTLETVQLGARRLLPSMGRLVSDDEQIWACFIAPVALLAVLGRRYASQ